MEGLQKITDAVISEAEKSASEIINKAKEKAEQIRAKAEGELAEKERQLEKMVNSECKSIMESALLSDRQNRNKALLKVRSSMIDEIIDEAKQNLLSLPDHDYFEVLLRIFSKNAQPSDGYIHFSPSDYKRVPRDFLKRCQSLFPKHSLKLSDKTENISGGFIIKYGNIEQNCSLDSIFEAMQNILRDRANECLS